MIQEEFKLKLNSAQTGIQTGVGLTQWSTRVGLKVLFWAKVMFINKILF